MSDVTTRHDTTTPAAATIWFFDWGGFQDFLTDKR